jgi:hypothetical protein
MLSSGPRPRSRPGFTHAGFNREVAMDQNHPSWKEGPGFILQRLAAMVFA